MSLLSKKLFIRNLFIEGIASVKPDRLINSVMKFENDNLIINANKYNISKGRCYVVGFGKAILDMAFETEKILSHRLYKGILSLPTGLVNDNRNGSSLEIYHGAANNMPDDKSVKATNEIVRLVREAKENDLVLILISGGGSALLSKPKPGITLSEKIDVIKKLTNAGADIKELNCVRKKLSDVKGGKLSREIFPASYVSFILSDIVGDPVEMIASGPTVRDVEPPSVALNILRKYDLENKVHENILDAIVHDSIIDSDVFSNSQNIILGNNSVALETMRKTAIIEGYHSIILSNKIENNIEPLSSIYAQLAGSIIDGDIENIKDALSKLQIDKVKTDKVVSIVERKPSKICLLLGGETVVTVKGKGKGGRNQELALRFSMQLNKKYPESSIIFLSAGTDGIDGPTDAAGAISYPTQADRAMNDGLDPFKFLSDSDSYNYYKRFEKSNDLIQIGHTGVNVMDLHILLLHLT